MRKTVRICCFVMGAVLLLSALFLVIYNIAEDKKSGETAERVLSALKRDTPEYPAPDESSVMPAAEQYDLYAEYEAAEESSSEPEMETLALDGDLYIGIIAIPELNIELPVAADWSYPKLKKTPCRYMGSVNTDDLIICAHNYNTHFGTIKNLHTDSEILFTDVQGKTYRYLVLSMEELPGTAVEQMQFGDADDWDLTLFTCTLGGRSRVTVRAVKAEE